jgi:hypothetical protein
LGGGGSKSFPSAMDIIYVGIATWNLQDLSLFHVSRLSYVVPRPDVPLQSLQTVVILVSSEGKLSHLVTFYIIILLLQDVLIYI